MTGPYIVLLPLNDTFEPKTIQLPFLPEVVKIGRQTNKSTLPFRDNGYFDSKVLSRSHAEIWANAEGRVCIKDIKSSNGTFVNGVRLSKENEESEVRELLHGDTLELGIDILNDDNGTIIHRKVSARVNHAGRPAETQGSQFASTSNSLPTPPVLQQTNGTKRIYDNTANGSNTSLSSMASGQMQHGTGRHHITVDMVIKKLNNDLKLSKQVCADLRETSQLFVSRSRPTSTKDATRSPFASKSSAAIKSDLSSRRTNQDSDTVEGVEETISRESPMKEHSFELNHGDHVARIEQLEVSLMQEREARMLVEEKWHQLLDNSTRKKDEDEVSIASDSTARGEGSAESYEVPIGMDEVSEANGGGAIERLENMLRASEEEVARWKIRTEIAEGENRTNSSRILDLVAELERSRSESGPIREKEGSPFKTLATPEIKGVKAAGAVVADKGGRGAALVSMVGMVMLGIGLMSFLNDYGPKKDF